MGRPTRTHACTILLPDGTVFVSGGTRTDGTDPEPNAGGVRHGKDYDPETIWISGEFESNGNWTLVAAAAVIRHYHTTFLPMPNGTARTAGSDGPAVAERLQEASPNVLRRGVASGEIRSSQDVVNK